MPDRDVPQVQVEATPVSKSRRLARRVRRDNAPANQRLGVGDLLLWLTFVAVYFGVVRSRAVDFNVDSLGLTLLLAQAVIAGVGWSSLWLVIFRWVRGLPLPQAPGHWLLFVLGGRLAIEVLLGFKPGEIFARPDAVSAAAMCCLLVVPTLDLKMTLPWRALFTLLVLIFGWPLLQTCLHVWFDVALTSAAAQAGVTKWVFITLSASGPLVLSIAFAIRGTRHLGLHWVGVTSWVVWHLIQPALINRFV